MVNQITERSITRRLSEKDLVLVSGLPFSGKTTTLRKLLTENDIIIELPKEINNLGEFNDFKQKLSELSKDKDRKIVVEGRNYIVELFLGKVTLKEPSLRNPHVNIEGNALTFHTQDILEEVNGEELTKILEYSLITMPNYSTYIPKLVDEAKELYKKGKLDEILPIVVKFKEVYSRFPSREIDGEDAILYPLLSLFPSPEEMKGAWLKLSNTWKELIFYRIDSALRILPGQSKKVISNFLEKIEEKEPKLEKWNYTYTPEFLEAAEYIATMLLNNKNVVLRGAIKTGKTTISNEAIKNLLSRDNSYSIVLPTENSTSDKKIIIIDYHSENYENLRHISSYLRKKGHKFIILTDDLAETLNISEPKYEVDSTNIFKYFVKNRSKNKISDPKLSYYALKNPNIVGQEADIRKEIENNYRKDLTEYIYEVIFEEDPNLIKWYSPLIAVGLKYGFPLPVGVSRKILEYSQRKIEKRDILVKWFSVTSELPPNIKEKDEGGDIKNFEEKSSEILEFLRKTIIDEAKSKNLIDDLLINYSHTILKNILVLSNTKFDNYFLAGEEVAPISYKILKNVIQDIMDYLTDGCEKLPKEMDLLKVLEEKDIISDEDINSLFVYSFLYYLSIDKDYSNVIKTIIKSNDKKCLITALRLLILYTLYGEKKAFRVLEKFIFDKIMNLKEEELVRHYVSLSLTSEYRNIQHIKKISELSPISKAYALLLLPKRKGKSPIEIFANTISLDMLAEKAFEKENVDGFIKTVKKFEKNLNLLKNIAKRIDKGEGAKVASTAFFASSLDFAIKRMEIDKDKYNSEIGIFYYTMLPPDEDLKDTLRLAEFLSLPYYNYLIRENSKRLLYPDEIELLFNTLQIRLAKSLVSGNAYEYKNILSDFIDFSEKYYTPSLSDAQVIAKIALKQNIKIPSDTHLITLAAEAFSGKNIDEFLRVVESLNINIKDIKELINIPEFAESKIIYSIIKGENVGSYISYLNKNGIGPMYKISHKLLEENDKSRYIASLILFL
ncbi:hypothetical protein [Acidianus brierleyi]|uniref:Uncharacterized protein n=1 Tax=Acidianus brierleyi TaxID=41673 RepID=A0A2U9IHM4_9CREN|nr:hypothetical protein [Acidianus brierleyi]AWR95543.1 hypothetical protein DFR85_14050 [Acidianus brierleyi]